jgi:hypothetical protein
MKEYVDMLKRCGFSVEASWFAPTDIPVLNILERVLIPIPLIGGLARRRICIRAVK